VYLNNCEIGPQLFEHIETNSTEVKKFPGIATLPLNPLSLKLELSRREYVAAVDATELHSPPKWHIWELGPMLPNMKPQTLGTAGHQCQEC